jgi:phosphoribosyl 1,2-cyclic phosphodiesterase
MSNNNDENDVFLDIVKDVEPEPNKEPILRHLYSLSVSEMMAFNVARKAAINGDVFAFVSFVEEVLAVGDESKNTLLNMTFPEFFDFVGNHFSEGLNPMNGK